MSLFQRIKTPFREMAEDDADQPERRARIGTLLRDRREELGLDLDSVGESLRIKPIYLAALEQGRTQDLPGPTYALGFVRAYAHYLDLDSERVVDSYKAECTDVHARPDLALPVALGERSLPGGRVLLVGLILALCGYGSWYYVSSVERSRPERVSAVPAELQQLAPVAAANPPAIPSASTSAAPRDESRGPAAAAAPRLTSGLLSSEQSSSTNIPAPPGASPAIVASPASAALPAASAGASPAAPVPAVGDAGTADPPPPPPPGETAAKGQIEIRALADCWIQISASDQSIIFSKVLKAGETYRVPRPGLSLRTGNAGALAIAVDGKPAPAIGGLGALRRNVSLEPDSLLAGTAVRG